MNSSLKVSRAILVLGMHRSGTSATMRVINLLGADLGDDLLPVAGDNPRGFWEHRGVVAIHEELLGALNRSWHDIRAMPDNWLSSEAASIAREKLHALLSDQFSKSALWAVKDPRLSRLLPLWLQVLGDLNVETRVVFVLRNPVEVARSLAARDGLATQITHLSWLQYVLEAELGSRDLVRSVITYDGLLRNWSECMLKLARELEIQWPKSIKDVDDEVSCFLDTSERHHRGNDAELAVLPELVRSAYEIFLAIASGDATWEKIKQFNDAYQLNAKVFLGAVAETASQLEALKASEAQKSDQMVRLETRLLCLRAAFKEVSAQTLPDSEASSGGAVKDVAKIYFRSADEAYSETRCARFPYEGLQSESVLKFEVESLAGVDFVRFDPSELPGDFFIRDIRINGKRVESTECKVASFNQYLVLGDSNGFRFKSSDEDPYLEFDIRDQFTFRDAAVSIELSCQRLTADDGLRQIIRSALQLRTADESARWSDSIRLQQATQAGVDTIEERFTEQQERMRSDRSAILNNLDQQTKRLSDTVKQLIDPVATMLGVLQDDVRSGQQETEKRLEAIETEVGQALASMQARMASDQEQHAAQHVQTQDHLKAMAEAFSQAMSEHGEAIASLLTQTSNLAEGQEKTGESQVTLARQLTALLSLCELDGRKLQELANQQVVCLANQAALRDHLREVSEYQQRNFLTSFRRVFSKKKLSH